MATISRRRFVQGSAAAGGLAAMGPLGALSARAATSEAEGYGPLVNKGELWLPEEFNYQVISRQGDPMIDGQPTPGIFDGMAAYDGRDGRTILIRNHENRERAGEQKVMTPPVLQYNELAFGGNTKLEVSRRRAGRDPVTGQRLYTYEVGRDFAILGGTSTNCAGGVITLISPARSRFSWLRIRIVFPSRPLYAAIPSKMPGVGCPSSIGWPCREMTW